MESAPTGVYWHRVIAAFAAQRSIWRGPCTVWSMDRLPPTPISTLTRFRELAMAEVIRYVYVGNVPEHEGNYTYCHHCKKLLIVRQGYRIPAYNLEGDQCKFCKTVIPGIWYDMKDNPV